MADDDDDDEWELKDSSGFRYGRTEVKERSDRRPLRNPIYSVLRSPLLLFLFFFSSSSP